MEHWEDIPTDIQIKIKKIYYKDYVKDTFAKKLKLINFLNKGEKDRCGIYLSMSEIVKFQVLLEKEEIPVEIIIDRKGMKKIAHQAVYNHAWYMVMSHRISYEDYRATRAIRVIAEGRYYRYDGDEWWTSSDDEPMYYKSVIFYIDRNGVRCEGYEDFIKLPNA